MFSRFAISWQAKPRCQFRLYVILCVSGGVDSSQFLLETFEGVPDTWFAKPWVGTWGLSISIIPMFRRSPLKERLKTLMKLAAHQNIVAKCSMVKLSESNEVVLQRDTLEYLKCMIFIL